MKNNIKNISVFLLLFIFLTPISVKIIDDLYHDHSLNHKYSEETRFHSFKEKCPVEHFVLSVFTTFGFLYEINSSETKYYFNENYLVISLTNSLKFSFLSRGPPNMV